MPTELLINYILYKANYIEVYFYTLLYFLFLYFAVGQLFLVICKFLEKQGWVSLINTKEPSQKQIRYEIKQSTLSIVLFGSSGIPIIYLIRQQQITLLDDNWINIAMGLILLTFWNEIHFFVIHRIMHLKYFMKKVHYVHHKSRISTIYSVFSFHWIEAFLLSTVMLSIVTFFPFAPTAIALFPLVSILLNFSGHSNYRFGKGKTDYITSFATRHNQHHKTNKETYGFATPYLDQVLSTLKKL